MTREDIVREGGFGLREAISPRGSLTSCASSFINLRLIRPGGSMALGIRKGDVVRVVKGSDRGKQGKVIAIDAERGRVRVEKVRVHKRHLKPGRRGSRTGGILEEEGFVDASNVMLVDGKGAATRARTELRDGRRVRVFVSTGEPVPAPATG